MKILLDTHIALWAMTDTAKLSEEVIHMLESGKMKCIIVLPLYGKLQLSIKSDRSRCQYQKRSLSGYVRKQVLRSFL